MQRKSTGRLIRWLAHIVLQPLMTGPKCHTLKQSSTRFRDSETWSLLVCLTWSSKTLTSEGTSSQRWGQPGNHISPVWDPIRHLQLDLLFYYWGFLFRVVFQGGMRKGMAIFFILWSFLRTLKYIPSCTLLSLTHVTLTHQTPSTLTTFWMPMGHLQRMKLLCPSL